MAPLTGENLDALLQVDEGHIEAEDIAAEAGDVGETVAGVGDGEDPVHDQRPPSSKLVAVGHQEGVSGLQAYPTHESEIIGPPRCDDIVNGIIEDSNRSCA